MAVAHDRAAARRQRGRAAVARRLTAVAVVERRVVAVRVLGAHVVADLVREHEDVPDAVGLGYVERAVHLRDAEVIRRVAGRLYVRHAARRALGRHQVHEVVGRVRHAVAVVQPVRLQLVERADRVGRRPWVVRGRADAEVVELQVHLHVALVDHVRGREERRQVGGRGVHRAQVVEQLVVGVDRHLGLEHGRRLPDGRCRRRRGLDERDGEHALGMQVVAAEIRRTG